MRARVGAAGRTVGSFRRIQFTELEIAEPAFVLVIGQHDVARDFVAESGCILEFAFCDRLFQRWTSEFVDENFFAVQPMLDLASLNKDAREIPFADGLAWFVGGSGQHIVERTGLPLGTASAIRMSQIIEHLVFVAGAGSAAGV